MKSNAHTHKHTNTHGDGRCALKEASRLRFCILYHLSVGNLRLARHQIITIHSDDGTIRFKLQTRLVRPCIIRVSRLPRCWQTLDHAATPCTCMSKGLQVTFSLESRLKHTQTKTHTHTQRHTQRHIQTRVCNPPSDLTCALYLIYNEDVKPLCR